MQVVQGFQPRFGGVWLMAALLCGCGGGGGGGSATPVAPAPTSFSIAGAYAAFLSKAHTTNFAVSGDCGGVASWTYGTPSALSFHGDSALAVTQTRSRTLTGCTLASGQSVRTFYFSTGYDELGLDIQGGSYGFAQVPLTLGPPAAINTINVGGTVVSVALPRFATLTTSTIPATSTVPATTTTTMSLPLGTMMLYADSGLTIPVGRLVENFTDALTEGATVAIGATINKQVFDATGSLTETEIETYQISLAGVMTLTSVDIQYAGSNGTGHLVFTAQ